MYLENIRSVDICAYVKCNNGRHKGHHLYRFPKEDSPLFKEWISKIGNPVLKYYTSSTLRNMGVCADHFLPEMFKSNPTKNTNEKRKLKKYAIPEPPKNLLTNEEEEDVQASQLVIEKQLMRKKGEEKEERHQHRHYHYQQQQEAEGRKVEEEGENELFINKPTLDYTKAPLKFSDNEYSMGWVVIEPHMICDVQLKNSTRRTFQEMKLKNECAQLVKRNKNLRVQIKCLKRSFARIKRSRDRYLKKLRKLGTIDEFLDRHECKNYATKSQLESESIKYATEERDEWDENN